MFMSWKRVTATTLPQLRLVAQASVDVLLLLGCVVDHSFELLDVFLGQSQDSLQHRQVCDGE